jgi:FkbM family methyltransferase
VLTEGARVLDAGAYVGTFGLGLSLRRRLDALCFVEANRNVIPLLKSNVQANARCRCVVVGAMVGGADSTLRPGRGDSHNLGSTSFSADQDGEPVANLPEMALTLAQLRAQHGPFDLIKLDTEGMEHEILDADSDYLRHGGATLWVECNESPKSIALAELLLSWNLKTYYFAFPSHNPDNFRGEREPVYPWAYEAGLLIAPKVAPQLDIDLEAHGCIMRPIETIAELRDAMWFTPRWLPREFAHAGIAQLAAVAGRAILEQSRDEFLSERHGSADFAEIGHAEVNATKKERRDQLVKERERREAAELGLAQAKKLAFERLDQLTEESKRRELAEQALANASALAQTRLAGLEAERERAKAAEKELASASALAFERLDQFTEENKRREFAEQALAKANALALARLADVGAERERAEAAELELASASALAQTRLAGLEGERERARAAEKELVCASALAQTRFEGERERADAAERELREIGVWRLIGRVQIVFVNRRLRRWRKVVGSSLRGLARRLRTARRPT